MLCPQRGCAVFRQGVHNLSEELPAFLRIRRGCLTAGRAGTVGLPTAASWRAPPVHLDILGGLSPGW